MRELVDEAYRGLRLRPDALPLVLDPACGAGGVLLAAFQRIAAAFPALPAPRLLCSLTGFDSDRAAVSAARRVLADAAAEHEARRTGRPPSPALAARLARAVRVHRRDVLRQGVPGRYDLVIGNPPWVPLSGKHRLPSRDHAPARALARRLGADSYRPNLFELFLRLTLARLRPAGRQVFLVPDRLAHNRQYRVLRRTLLETARLRLLRFGVRIPGVHADALLYRLDAAAPRPTDTVRIRDSTSGGSARARVPQADLLAQEDCRFWCVPDPVLRALVARLLEGADRLGNHVATHTGFIASPGSVTAAPEGADPLPVLKGAHVRPFAVPGQAWLAQDRARLVGGTQDPRLLGARDKVLVPKTGACLRAALDTTGRWPEQSLYFLRATRRADLWIALALLNSRLARVIYAEALATNRTSLPHLKKMDLDRIPWPAPDDPRTARVARAGRRATGVDAAVEAAFRLTAAERAALASAAARLPAPPATSRTPRVSRGPAGPPVR